jgi:predicted small secreted protein
MTVRGGPAPVALYLATTFAVTWLLWWACARVESPRWLFALGGPVFLVGVFAPGLVALAFTARRDGAAGARRLLSGIARWGVPARLYLFALGFMAATRLVAAVVHRFATGEWPAVGDAPVPLTFAGILVSTWVQAGEEVGWRAYLLPRLQALPLYLANFTVGLLWFVFRREWRNLAIAVTACNTIEGAGKDVKAAGGAVEKAATKSKTY